MVNLFFHLVNGQTVVSRSITDLFLYYQIKRVYKNLTHLEIH